MRTSPSLGAIRAMSDDVGILQHGIGIVPDRANGYCIDDNARALMLLNSLDPRAFAENDALALRYASFAQHAWHPAIGRFRNFLAHDGHCFQVGGRAERQRAPRWGLRLGAGRVARYMSTRE